MDKQNSGLSQDDFRKLLSTPRAERDPSEAASFLSKRRFGAIPKVPRNANQKQILEKDSPFAEPKPRKKTRPKDGEKEPQTETKYRDRASERRKGINSDYQSTELIIQTLEKNIQSTPLIGSGSNTATSEAAHDTSSSFISADSVGRQKSMLQYEQSKYLGGDAEHTHLVKGLDYLLLAKMKQKQKHNLKSQVDVTNSESLDIQLEKAAEKFDSLSPPESASGQHDNILNSNNQQLEVKDDSIENEITSDPGYAPITKLGKAISLSLNRLKRRFEICQTLRGFADASIADKISDRVTKSEIFQPLQIYHVFETSTSSATANEHFLANIIPKTVFRNQDDVKELTRSLSARANGNMALYLDSNNDKLVITKVANAIAAIRNKKTQAKLAKKQLIAGTTANAGTLHLASTNSNTITTKAQSYSKIFNADNTDNNNNNNSNNEDEEDDIFADAGTEYQIEPRPEPKPSYNTPSLSSLDITPSVTISVGQSKDQDDDEDDQDVVTGPYPNVFNQQHGSEQASGDENENANANGYMDGSSSVVGPYPDVFAQESTDGSGSENLVTRPYPNIYGFSDDSDDSNTNTKTNITILQEQEQIRKRKPSLGPIMDTDDYYTNDIGLLSDEDSGDEEFKELSAMDVGSTSKFKRTQLTRYDFDSLEEWAEYKDSIVQLPKAAFQFGIKSKDASASSNKAKSAHRLAKRKLAAFVSNDATFASTHGAGADGGNQGGDDKPKSRSESRKETRHKEKFDKSWQETKRFMVEKYGDTYFRE